jgi:(p)ppGpp synthase/HD superfamily hydrolase
MKLTPRIQNAIDYAAAMHVHAKRKAGGQPYVVHPFAVAWMLADAGANEDTVVAGLLHDILEDVEGSSPKELTKLFGARVTKIVQGVSEEKVPGSRRKLPWLIRKQRYLDHLATADRDTVLVSVADKIHNLRSMSAAYKEQGEAMWKSFHAPADRKLWFYEEVLKIAKKKLPKQKMVGELGRALGEMKELSS